MLSGLVDGGTAASCPPTEEVVSMEFLEYLGTFQTEEGEQVDPMSLESMEEEKNPAYQEHKGGKRP
ncbi:MAG: hypothetical protein K6360_05185 [Deltaproteobacteria bacterium]